MNKRFLQVEGHNDLVRDTESNAIVNKNRGAYLLAKQKRKMHKDKEMQSEMRIER